MATAPTIVGTPATNSGTTQGTNYVANYPSGIVANELLMCTIVLRGSNNTYTISTVPTGWTLIRNQSGFAFGSTFTFWKKATGSETGSVTFVGTSESWTCTMVRVSGADPYTPIGVSTGTSNETAAINFLSVNTTRPNCLVFCVANRETTDSTFTFSGSSLTQIWNVSATDGGSFARRTVGGYNVIVNAGASGSFTATQASASDWNTQTIVINSIGSLGTYNQEVLADNPSSYFRFEETSGSNSNDATTNNVDAIYYNGPSLNQTGFTTGSKSVKVSRSAGAYVYGDINAHFSLGDVFTIECWFKKSNATNSSAEYIFGQLSGSPYVYINTAGNIVFGKHGTGGQNGDICQSSITVNDTNWHHLAVVKNGSTSTIIYIDSVNRTGAVNNKTAANGGGGYTYMGAGYGAGQYSDLYLDEFALYKTALPSGRIEVHYNAILSQNLTNNISITNTSNARFIRSISKKVDHVSSSILSFTKLSSFRRTLSPTNTSVQTLTKQFPKIFRFFNTQYVLTNRSKHLLMTLFYNSGQHVFYQLSIDKIMQFDVLHTLDVWRGLWQELSFSNAQFFDTTTEKLKGVLFLISSPSNMDIYRRISGVIKINTTSGLSRVSNKRVFRTLLMSSISISRVIRSIDKKIFFSKAQTFLTSIDAIYNLLQQVNSSSSSQFSISKHITKFIPTSSGTQASIIRTINKLVEVYSSSTVTRLRKRGNDYIMDIVISSEQNTTVNRAREHLKTLDFTNVSSILDPVKLSNRMKRLINKIGV